MTLERKFVGEIYRQADFGNFQLKEISFEGNFLKGTLEVKPLKVFKKLFRNILSIVLTWYKALMLLLKILV